MLPIPRKARIAAAVGFALAVGAYAYLAEPNRIGQSIESAALGPAAQRHVRPFPTEWLRAEYHVDLPDDARLAEVVVLPRSGFRLPMGQILVLGVDEDGIVRWQGTGAP